MVNYKRERSARGEGEHRGRVTEPRSRGAGANAPDVSHLNHDDPRGVHLAKPNFQFEKRRKELEKKKKKEEKLQKKLSAKVLCRNAGHRAPRRLGRNALGRRFAPTGGRRSERQSWARSPSASPAGVTAAGAERSIPPRSRSGVSSNTRRGCCPRSRSTALSIRCNGPRATSVRYNSPHAGVAQWQSRSFPSLRRGFDSLHPLQRIGRVALRVARRQGGRVRGS